MLEILRRPFSRLPGGPDEPGDGASRSHVFPRFLKRLAARERPALLDLGRLSGANIEVFARLGCRVQVEDLMTAMEESAPEPLKATLIPAVAETGATAASPGSATAASPPNAQPPNGSSPNGHPVVRGGSAAAPGTHHLPPAAGRLKPARHIVLPPRLPGRPQATAEARPALPSRTPLATSFGHQDGAFDAIVGWDLFNYYDPESARRIAAETVRVLKTGGLVFATFHARRPDAPEGPRRHRIVDEAHLLAEPCASRPLQRYLYQNREIERLFTGLKIVELYFLKHGVREMLLEKRAAGAVVTVPAATPRAGGRFRIE
jgi:SAM-dependent methyltransferase